MIPTGTDHDTAPGSSTLVAGGGWAGLASAITLTRHGHPVTLIESSAQLGGRARSVGLNGLQVDNGQHLMIGAYREMLGLLQTIGVDEQSVLLRSPLHLLLRSLQQGDIELRLPPLPAPLHIAAALLFARGLKAAHKRQALGLCLRLFMRGFSLEQDCPLQAFLQAQGQGPFLIEQFWSPLCIGALNTRPQQASTRLFLQVLKQSFTGNRRHADLLIARCNLGALLPQPALEFLTRSGSSVQLKQRVTALCIERGRIQGVETGSGFVPAQQLVLALPPWRLPKLLAGHAALAPLAEGLQQLQYEPICTVYLQYPAATRLGMEMVGLRDGISQWIFDRRVCAQPGLMAVVISTHGAHMEWDNETLAQRVQAELALLFPHWPEPVQQQVIREKRATFSSTTHIGAIRPARCTAVSGCWLAGDYTDTGLPATLEGAIASGVQCARHILAAPATEDTQ